MTAAAHTARVVGVVLAGGGSRRMGRDKALIQVGGTPMIERAAAALSSLERLVVVTGDPQRLRPYLCPYDVTFVADIFPGRGPLAGVHAALTHLREDETGVVVLGCDMPFVPAVLPRLLAARITPLSGIEKEASHAVPPDAAAFIDTEGRRQHLLSAFHRRNLPLMDEMLGRQAAPSLGSFLARVRTEYLDLDGLARSESLPYPERTFVNVNTPAELLKARHMAEAVD